MSDNKTIYVGQGWENKFGLKLSINREKISSGISSGEIEVNKYGDIKLEVVKRKEKDEKSKATHFVKVDNYKPEKRDENTVPAGSYKDDSNQMDADDLPF